MLRTVGLSVRCKWKNRVNTEIFKMYDDELRSFEKIQILVQIEQYWAHSTFKQNSSRLRNVLERNCKIVSWVCVCCVVTMTIPSERTSLQIATMKHKFTCTKVACFTSTVQLFKLRTFFSFVDNVNKFVFKSLNALHYGELDNLGAGTKTGIPASLWAQHILCVRTPCNGK
jgi:hypothetical protein